MNRMGQNMKNVKSITVGGNKYIVGKVLSKQIFPALKPTAEMEWDVDIEFKDVNGRYRHYQSWSDGGIVEFED